MANRYYTGTGAWNTTASWGSSSGGTGASVPTTGDTAIFDSNSGTCVVDIDIVCDVIIFGGGTLTLGTYNVTIGSFKSSNSNTRTLNMGSGTWTLTGTGVDVWNCDNSTNLTLNCGTSTIKFADTSGGISFFQGGNNTIQTLTYYNFWNDNINSGSVYIFGLNIFNEIKISAGAVQVFSNVVNDSQTLNTLTATGTSLKKIYLMKGGGLAPLAILSKSSGSVNVEYCEISGLAVTGGATWNAWTSKGNIDAGNNTGWVFTEPISPTVVTTSVDTSNYQTYLALGNVTSDGGSPITERGFVWSLSANPTTADNKVIVAGTTGIYSGYLTGLTPKTTYHCRAYAINAIGTAYGADVEFSNSLIMSNQSKPTSSFSNSSKPITVLVNSTKASHEETWDSNTTNWDTEIRTWDEMGTIISNQVKP